MVEKTFYLWYINIRIGDENMEDFHKSSLILVLLSVVFVMAIGYAAFSQDLIVTSNAQITTKWDIHIEEISVASEVNRGKNIKATVGDDKLSASFETELIMPSSAVTYNITVKNGGTIDSKLNSLSFNDSQNEAIQFSYSGIQINDVLNSGASQTFTVTVTFNPDYTHYPDVTTSNLTMALGYVQA